MKKHDSYLKGKTLQVFIADDDPDDIALFKDAIREANDTIKITIAKDGEELLEFLSLVKPDLVFLDINMPGMNGIDALKAIRQKKALANIPVIIYSTTFDKGNVELTYSFGANLYIHKPSAYTTIRDRIRETLQKNLRDLIPQPPFEHFVVRTEKAVMP